ncbi:MAG: response regulator [Candidatus Methylomirabilales bacterium]
MADNSSPRILVVDDEKDLRLTLCQAFEMEGYEVREAADSAQAVSLLSREPFDVVLLDLMMPKIDGLSLLEKARSILPEAVIVVMTGQATVETAMSVVKEGAVDYIQKPFRLEHVFHVVARGLKEARLRQEKNALKATNERLEEIDQTRSDLLSAITHEFRTPLTIISGWVELLLADQSGPLNPEQREGLLAIREGSRRLGHMLSNVVAHVEHDRGVTAIEGGEVFLSEVLTSVLKDLRGAIRGKRLSIEIRPEIEGLSVHGDREKLRLLFFNLLEHAVKFNEADGEVVVSAKSLTSGVEVSVANTRGAFSPEHVTTLPAPSIPGQMSATRGVRGLGLGLSVATTIAAAHGGEIRFLLDQAHGETAVVRLPHRQSG